MRTGATPSRASSIPSRARAALSGPLSTRMAPARAGWSDRGQTNRNADALRNTSTGHATTSITSRRGGNVRWAGVVPAGTGGNPAASPAPAGSRPDQIRPKCPTRSALCLQFGQLLLQRPLRVREVLLEVGVLKGLFQVLLVDR